jgi:hypothetical protein
MATMQDMIRYHAEIQESGVLELVGKNEEVNTDDYGASVALTIGTSACSGELYEFVFIATEEGDGAVQDSAGWLLIFDADPATTAGDTSITAAERKTLIGQVEVTADDWITDANGGSAYIYDQVVSFHAVTSLYLVWFHTDDTDLNDEAGNDEVLEVEIKYRRYV